MKWHALTFCGDLCECPTPLHQRNWCKPKAMVKRWFSISTMALCLWVIYLSNHCTFLALPRVSHLFQWSSTLLEFHSQSWGWSAVEFRSKVYLNPVWCKMISFQSLYFWSLCLNCVFVFICGAHQIHNLIWSSAKKKKMELNFCEYCIDYWQDDRLFKKKIVSASNITSVLFFAFWVSEVTWWDTNPCDSTVPKKREERVRMCTLNAAEPLSEKSPSAFSVTDRYKIPHLSIPAMSDHLSLW